MRTGKDRSPCDCGGLVSQTASSQGDEGSQRSFCLTHTKVVLVAGNHDFVKQDSYYRSFRWARNVFPLLGKEMQKIEFPELRTAVSGFSYWDREYREGIRDSWKCRRTQDTEILILHGGDEKHLPFRKRETELLGYDYVALGHIHKPDQKEQQSSYCGALEPTDPNDTGDHGFILGAAANGLVKTRFVPFASRKYIHLDIQADEKMMGVCCGIRSGRRSKNRASKICTG